jgi:hypothetical protein
MCRQCHAWLKLDRSGQTWTKPGYPGKRAPPLLGVKKYLQHEQGSARRHLETGVLRASLPLEGYGAHVRTDLGKPGCSPSETMPVEASE